MWILDRFFFILREGGSLRLRGFPRSETVYLEDPPPLPLPVNTRSEEGKGGRGESGEQETTEDEGHLEPQVSQTCTHCTFEYHYDNKHTGLLPLPGYILINYCLTSLAYS